ncbi:MAG: HAD family hydrolase, partial [Clostridiales bacterium]|nr:HAD family hydrolase [Clostridiales bacterium]
MYKLIFTDFDKTLVGDDLIISNENLEAIKKAQKKGVQIMLCTGRSFLKLKQFEDIIGISGENAYGVAFNGGIVYKVDDRKIIRDKRIELSLGREIIKKLRGEKASVLIYVKEKLYAERGNDEYINFYENKASLDVTYIDSFDYIE